MSHGNISHVAATWLLLLASLVCAHDHPTALDQRSNRTIPTAAAGASVSKDKDHQVVAPPYRAKGAQRFPTGLADRQQTQPQVAAATAAARDEPADETTLPSPRCASREEWQGTCRIWSGKPHNRYLAFNRMRSREGLGASLTRVAWALGHAISFDLELVINGPLQEGHDAGEFGDWMGLTHNPLLSIQDQAGFKKAVDQSVPFPQGNEDAWFLKQENRTSVVYTPNTMEVEKMKGWGIPTSPANPDARVCRYVRQVMRKLFWSVPQHRGRCRGLLPEHHDNMPPVGRKDRDKPPEAVISVSEAATGWYRQQGKRPWVIAVHVRRGDTLRVEHGARSIRQSYFSATVTSVLRGIAVIDPAAHVSVLVFSEGPGDLEPLQLIDETGTPVTWDVQRESCLDIGLVCSQKIHLQTTMFETFDCLAAADVVVGSASTFSDSAAAVSTNVKVMLRQNQTEQDRVALDRESAAFTPEEQSKMDTAIADWWYCSREAQRATGSDERSRAARGFYQTVDGVLPSPLD